MLQFKITLESNNWRFINIDTQRGESFKNEVWNWNEY